MGEFAVAEDLAKQSGADGFASVNGDGGDPAVGVPQAMMPGVPNPDSLGLGFPALRADDLKAELFQRADQLFAGDSFAPWHGGSGQLHPLNADKRSARRARTFGEAECDCFSHALHQHVQRFGLRVTTAQFGNIGYKVAFFILLDDDGKWIGTLGHERIIRHWSQ